MDVFQDHCRDQSSLPDQLTIATTGKYVRGVEQHEQQYRSLLVCLVQPDYRLSPIGTHF